MRSKRLTVRLRLRSAWEAMDLGIALVRRHAWAVWSPWLLVSVLVLVPLNLACWALGKPWLAGLLAWWLKPVFDRVVLYVIAHAVFGTCPAPVQTLRAQLRWGWRPMVSRLLWRRLSPARSLLLPLELLEGGRGPHWRERWRALAWPAYGIALVLTLVSVAFSWIVSIALPASVLFFVHPLEAPQDYLLEAVSHALRLLAKPQPSVQLALNLAFWCGTSVIEPFFLGAGFGLYLNRRTQIEAWDVEIAFRSLAARLRAAATPLAIAVMLAVALPVPALRAQSRTWPAGAEQAPAQVHHASADLADEDEDEQASSARQDGDEHDGDEQHDGEEQDAASTPHQVFGDQLVDARRFQQAAERAWKDPSLNRKQMQAQWERIPDTTPPPEPSKLPDLSLIAKLQRLLALLAEGGLWIIAVAVLGLLLATAPRWWPWMRGIGRIGKTSPAPVRITALELPDTLPADIAASARELWRTGQHRHALALLYRASVEAMAQRAGVTLPPGATEAQCLRASRRQPQPADRSLFARMVQVWQYAAYARQLPDADAFDALLAQLQERYQWAR